MTRSKRVIRRSTSADEDIIEIEIKTDADTTFFIILPRKLANLLP